MKTILLGMNNPDPSDAFAPWKRGASGERLWKMMVDFAEHRGLHKITKEEFVECFDRMNMLDEPEWDLKRAKENRYEVLQKLVRRRVVVFGFQTLEALGYGRVDNWTMTVLGTWYITLPHPSGLTHAYNDAAFRDFVGGLLYYEVFRH